LGLELGLETCELGLDNFTISGLGLGERGLGLATMGLDYKDAVMVIFLHLYSNHRKNK